MEFELWWLLILPLLFALGWFSARADLRQQSKEARRLPDAYFRGLNHLLNEESDRAIDAFVDVVRLDPEAAELHFALGNLFRRRGETDRAIRVHEHLAGRMDLAEKVRDQAQYELGQDYLKAGLLDRAEEVFTRLAPTALASRAAFCRLEIAQTERDWPRAIALGREWLAIPIERLEIAEREKRQVVAQWIVHFYCEQVSEAALLAAAAMPEGERHPRVLQLTAEFARQRGDFAAAVAAWMVLGEAAPIYLAPVAPQVLDDWRNAGRLEEGIHWLEDCHQREPSSDFVQAIARSRLALNGLSAAQTWATRALAERPSLRGLESLLALREGSTPNGQPANAGGASSALSDALIRQLMRPQLQRVARYRCLQCGFEGRQFHWHCPGCHRWASCSPRRVEEIQG
jgi:lipopolysaccharide biosynthesis regulator YciM